MQKSFSEKSLLLGTSTALALAYAAFAAVRTQQELWALCVPLVAASSLLETVLSAQLTRLVPARLAGTSNALDMAVGSGVRMVSPVLSALLLTSASGFGTVGFVSAALMAACVALLYLGSAAAAPAATAQAAGAAGGTTQRRRRSSGAAAT